MLFLIINTLNTLFKTPQIYELVFPIKNPYAFKKFYFSISLNSEESKTSLIKLNKTEDFFDILRKKLNWR